MTDRWSRIGLSGIYLFAAFALLGITPATVGLVVSTLVFGARFDGWRRLGRDPVAMLALVFGLYVVAHSLAFYLAASTPEQAATVLDHGTDWLKLLLFIPVAYWIAGRPERIRLLLLLALLGFTIGITRKIDWATFDASFFTTRFLSYLPAIAFGMFTGIAALGLLATRRAFWGAREQPLKLVLRVGLWAALLLIMLQGLLLSQSRGSWLGFLAGLGLLILLEWRAGSRAVEGGGGGRRWLPVLLGVAALVIFVLSQYQTIATRLADQTDTLKQVIQGEVTEITSDPIGLRVNALQFAQEKWLERPAFGWGAGSSRELIANSGRPEALLDNVNWLPHLHNAYAETLVQLGAVGFVLAFALVWALVRSSRQECRAGQIPFDLCRFFAVSLVFVLIWNLFNYRVVRSDWMFFWILFAGAAYSFRFARLTGHDGPGQA
jgi:O-antigen ligase